MRNTNKKGFTIVELVIVIAVIAILAAVLIPTFSGIIAKANESADKKAVHDMNTALGIAGNPNDIDDAIDALIENGFNGDNLVPVSKGYSFVWNESTKKIELVKTAEPLRKGRYQRGNEYSHDEPRYRNGSINDASFRCARGNSQNAKAVRIRNYAHSSRHVQPAVRSAFRNAALQTAR